VGHARLAAWGPVAIFVAVVASILALTYARSVRLRVGADGVTVKRGFGARTFFAHDAIRDVRAEDGTVVLEPLHGETMRFSVSARRRPRKHEDVGEVAASIVRRVREAREAFRQLADAPEAALVLDRGERSTREWLQDLEALGEGATASFRRANVSREQLLHVVESTSASARERLAAIVALRPKLTEEEKPRVRVAAERCVLPALRERMVRVADAADDEDLAAALEEAESLDVNRR